MLRLYLNGTLFWSADPSELDERYAIFSLSTKEAINEIGTMSFSMMATHPRYSEIHIGGSIFVLTNNDDCVFFGRVASLTKDANFAVNVEVENMFSVLKEGYYQFTSSGGELQPASFSVLVADTILYLNYPISTISETYEFVSNSVLNRYYTEWSTFIQYSLSSDVDLSDYIDYTPSDNNEQVISLYDLLFEKLFFNNCIIVFDNVRITSTSDKTRLNSMNVDLNIYRDPYEYANKPVSKDLYIDPSKSLISLGYYDSYESYIDDVTVVIPVDKPLPKQGGTFVFGENIFDITTEPFVNDQISGIVITGNFKYTYNDYNYVSVETPKYYDSSISGYKNSYTIFNKTIVSKIGTRLRLMNFGEYEYYDNSELEREKDQLYEDAQEWADKHLIDYGTKFTVKGIDNYYLTDKLYYICTVVGQNEYHINNDYYINLKDSNPEENINWHDWDPPESENNPLAGDDYIPSEDEVDDEDKYYKYMSYWIDLPTALTHVGDYVEIISEPHSLYRAGTCLSKEIDYFNHTNDSYIVGPYIKDNVYDDKISNT